MRANGSKAEGYMREKQGNLCKTPPRTILGRIFKETVGFLKWVFFGTFFAQSKKVQKETLTLKEKEKRKKQQPLSCCFYCMTILRFFTKV